MSMWQENVSDLFWKIPFLHQLYHNVDADSEKLADEYIVDDHIWSMGDCIVVDLGIGTGRELVWLRRLPNLQRIVGVDYNRNMLAKCAELWQSRCRALRLVEGNLRKLGRVVDTANERVRICYVCLANTFGNLEKKHWASALEGIGRQLRKEDRLLLYLYRRGAFLRQRRLPTTRSTTGSSARWQHTCMAGSQSTAMTKRGTTS